MLLDEVQVTSPFLPAFLPFSSTTALPSQRCVFDLGKRRAKMHHCAKAISGRERKKGRDAKGRPWPLGGAADKHYLTLKREGGTGREGGKGWEGGRGEGVRGTGRGLPAPDLEKTKIKKCSRG